MNSILSTTHLAPQSSVRHVTLVQAAVIGFIRLYQHTLSPDHGPLFQWSTLGCRFYPSCSEYTARAVRRYGVMRGVIKGAARILRCTPWTEGGIDDIN